MYMKKPPHKLGRNLLGPTTRIQDGYDESKLWKIPDSRYYDTIGKFSNSPSPTVLLKTSWWISLKRDGFTT
jgi:hypothetical protein